jgi:hypothetical protein
MSSEGTVIREDKVITVWLTKVLKNNKGLFTTTLPDGMYYEFTYNGETNELYFDAYKKWEHITFSGIQDIKKNTDPNDDWTTKRKK